MIILFGGQKGGTGKSTLVMNLAVERAREGVDVLVVDADKQATASKFATIRSEEKIQPRVPCVQVFGKELGTELRSLGEKYEDIFVDTRGTDSVELRSALVVADLFVTPVQPSQADLDTLGSVAELVTQVEPLNPSLQSYIVFTRAPTNFASTDFKDSREYCADFEQLRICDCPIRERVAFKRTHTYGTSVAEPPTRDIKAGTELLFLYGELLEKRG